MKDTTRWVEDDRWRKRSDEKTRMCMYVCVCVREGESMCVWGGVILYFLNNKAFKKYIKIQKRNQKGKTIFFEVFYGPKPQEFINFGSITTKNS